MHCLRDGAGDHERQIPRLLLSLQRSPGLAVISILLVGPPRVLRERPDFRRASAAALALRLSRTGGVGVCPGKKIDRASEGPYAGLPLFYLS